MQRSRKDKRQLPQIPRTAWFFIDAAWTIINVRDYYLGKHTLENNRSLWIFIIVIPIAITVVYSVFVYGSDREKEKLKKDSLQDKDIIRFHRNIIDGCFTDIYRGHPDILIKDIKKASDNSDWERVIQIGKYGSRLFLMLAQYDLRIKYGEYIISAAKKVEDSEAMAMGYIDCVGWSYVQKGDYDNAKDAIKKGTDIIENEKNREAVILKCKANRHLAGIALKQADINTARSFMKNYETDLKRLRGNERKIMKGGLCILKGDILKYEKKKEDAKKSYQQAKKLFKKCDDFERMVKTYHKIGLIDEDMGQDEMALCSYIVGYWLSEKACRVDEMSKNCQSICRILSQKPDLLQKATENKEVRCEFERNNIKNSFTQTDYENEMEKMEANRINSVTT